MLQSCRIASCAVCSEKAACVDTTWLPGTYLFEALRRHCINRHQRLDTCCCFWFLQGAEHEAFIKVAQANEDATFVQTSDKAVAKAAGLDKAGSVTVITNFPSECLGLDLRPQWVFGARSCCTSIKVVHRQWLPIRQLLLR